MPLFLSAADPPLVIAPGLYAGLKSRGGFATPLPLVLGEEYYVNAGLIDGLSTDLVRQVSLSSLRLRIIYRGAICLQWYCLTRSGEIRHFSDSSFSTSKDTCDAITVETFIPSVLLADINVTLILFRVFHDKASKLQSGTSELIDWCFIADDYPSELANQPPLRMVSRSLGDSQHLVDQHLTHLQHLLDLQNRFPDLQFLPMPNLHIYESDIQAHDDCVRRINNHQQAQQASSCIEVFHNPFNLGGGGNMCWAINESLVECDYKGDFIMLDSDTLVPFKTLYSSALISGSSTSRQNSEAVFTPVIAFRKSPTKILEAGALFGRGAWSLAEDQPLQPCIFPFHHGEDLSHKQTMATVFQGLTSEYPPFIYGLYRLSKSHERESLLPAPFFLRGDDIEYGLHLRSRGVPIHVHGSLLVFQDPKHSLWHELLAILHATTILIAYTSREDLGLLTRNLSSFFRCRMEDHASIRDLHGMSTYHEALKRLLSLLPLEDGPLLRHYYNTDYYLGLRHLNAPYNRLNYSMAKGISTRMPADRYAEIPFLYFPKHPPDQPLPTSILLMNHLTEMATVHKPNEVSATDVDSACQKYQLTLSIMIDSIDTLHVRCKQLVDRSLIKSYFDHLRAESVN